MRRQRRGALAVALLAIAGLLAGCADEPPSPYMTAPPMWEAAPTPVAQPDAVYIDMAPPPMLVEVVPARPFAEAVWIGGYWDWRSRWVWCPGRWAPPPRPGYVWMTPYYEYRGGGVMFVPGFWRPTRTLINPPGYRPYRPPSTRWPRPDVAAPPASAPTGSPRAPGERWNQRWKGVPETSGAVAPPAPVAQPRPVQPFAPRAMSAPTPTPSPAPAPRQGLFRPPPAATDGGAQRDAPGEHKSGGTERRSWKGRKMGDQ